MLTSKIVVITSYSSDFEKLTAIEFAKKGAIVCYLSANTSHLKTVENDIKKISNKYLMIKCNLKKINEIKKAISKIKLAFNKIDIWLNGSDLLPLAPFNKSTLDFHFDSIKDNLKSNMQMTSEILEYLDSQGFGTIINVSSIASLISLPYMSSFSSYNHALNGFTRSLQQELKHEGSVINLKLFIPGLMNSNNNIENYPKWLNFMLSHPSKVASDLVKFSVSKQLECTSGIQNVLLNQTNKLFPKFVQKNTKFILTQSISDALKGKLTRPRI